LTKFGVFDVTAAPLLEIEELKKLVAGLCALESTVVFRLALSPTMPRSPS